MLSIDIYDTVDGCAADVYEDGKKLTREQVAMHGFLRWYDGGVIIAEGSSCECAVGTAVECRLEA
jgi:hypothetical protein